MMSAANRIDSEAAVLKEIREKLENRTLSSIRKILPNAAVNRACRVVRHPYRRRVITPVVTVLHMILAALWPEESFAASWQVIWDSMVSRLSRAAGRSPRSGSVSKARSRLPLALWEHLFEWLSKKAQKLSQRFDKWRGHRVVLLDGTCVSMPDEPQLFEAFGTSRGKHGKRKYPLARLVTVALANTMTVLAYRIGGYPEAETTLGFRLLETLEKGDILVADRLFAAAHFYHFYVSHALEFLTRVHQRLRISRLRRIVAYGRGDFVTELKINKIYRKKDPTLPSKVMVRLIHAVIRIRGKRQVIWLVTSLLDGERYPAREIIGLYARRWRIETLLREVKVDLSADVLRSKTSEGIRKEIAARLMAVNIVRMMILEAALQHDVDPLRISFAHATRAILAFADALGSEPIEKLPGIYQAMLREIAAHLVPQRPGRNEPRAVRREPKHYPTLHTTRKAWRLANAA